MPTIPKLPDGGTLFGKWIDETSRLFHVSLPLLAERSGVPLGKIVGFQFSTIPSQTHVQQIAVALRAIAAESGFEDPNMLERMICNAALLATTEQYEQSGYYLQQLRERLMVFDALEESRQRVATLEEENARLRDLLTPAQIQRLERKTRTRTPRKQAQSEITNEHNGLSDRDPLKAEIKD